MSRQSILLIEDDPQIRELVSEQIELMGFDLVVATDGETGLAKGLQELHALVLLDVNLPLLGGVEVCRRLKDQKPELPIIMISARGSEMDKVLGLQLGADDYVVKPFSVAELGARIQARLRSVQQKQVSPVSIAAEETGIVSIGPIEINVAKRQVFKNGTMVSLTALEFDLFYLLASNPGIVFSREKLLEQVWGVSSEAYENSPTPVITRIRKKVEDDPANPKLILTVWSVGYRFAEAKELVTG